MSLATAGGGGAGLGGAGLSMAAMAHGGPNAGAMANQVPTQTHSGIPGSGGAGYGAAPGTSYAALGADLLDKNQSFLNGKNVRNVATLPLVAVDLYGDKCDVAYFPPMDKDDTNNGQEDEMAQMMKAMAKVKKGVQARSVGGYSDSGTNVTLKKDDGDAYKAVKRYLNKGEGHGIVLEDALTVVKSKKNGKANAHDVIVISRPHLVMGARKTSDLNAAAKSTFASILSDNDNSDDSSPIIDQTNATSPLCLTTIAMDGNSQPKGDDYDRVAFQMRLNSKKKPMTILPEEALALIIAQCKKSVKEDYCKAHPESELNNEDNDEESYMDFPPAFAIPGWATMDATIEALIDAAGGSSSSCGPSLHQRGVAACVGALLAPPTPTKNDDGNGKEVQNPNEPPSSKLHKLLMETMQSKDGEAQKEAGKQAALNRTDPVEPDPFVPLVVLVGATKEGIEMTAVQISKPQGPDKELHCPFGNISVISSVCHAVSSEEDALSILESTLNEIRSQIGVAVPESEEPTAFVTYGLIGTQVKLASKLKATLTKYGTEGQGDDDWDGWDQDIPLVSTKEECVSVGLAVLAASVHGRVKLVVSTKGTDGKMRPKPRIGVAVQDVATCAVAVSFNYFSGKKNKWTEPKVIFDFDRRVPAGPYQIDFTAAECAAHVRHGNKTNDKCIEDESNLIDEAKSLEGSRGIPEREKAALQLRFRLYQRTARGNDAGKWIRVGDEMRPLSMEHSQKDGGESGEDNLVANESAVLEISLNAVGLITTGLITNGETIVQATKSARNSKLLRWGGIIGSILFIGGFLVKSFVEERIFKRDTQRVMAYYKHAAPNSFHDGDERQAQYLVWKYKNKKDKLWRRLEVKYNIPVKHAWEWDDEDDAEKNDAKKEEDEEAEDLDGDKEGSEETEGDEL
mmetsp:Transcript_2605/g.5600  ORF Transcript_2605/g.5600 Transcript_2605/m.5600 type:complete len:909 (+) Transcript_2605:94-2820(+)|eukprot:CAMPEP_0172298572 /NCGR_PEP_ID=MMETSP1058-20130122/1166_1 /TAXON_ID=83371 /ORGANISM="Detonula confervacea, Strain CCMP 353" /LENGTH=908 /DNA_ID=CAMNT_0013007851 /DNA_START=10 /DNA_END=2736 /DNA_ORIENTATION=-